MLTDTQSVHEVSRRANTGLSNGIENCVKDTGGAATIDDVLVGSAFELANETCSVESASALTLSCDRHFVEGTIVAVSRSIDELTGLASVHTFVIFQGFARRTTTDTIEVDLACRTHSTVSVEQEAARGCGAINTTSIGSNTEPLSADTS